MPKKKLSPPKWDEKKNRWQKDAYCNGIRKTFYSTKKGATTAEREITAAINQWKEKMEGLSSLNQLTPMSHVNAVYHDFKLDIETRTSKSNWQPQESRFEHWILPLIGKIPIVDINSGTIQRIINYAYSKGNLSKKSLKNLRGDMAAFIKFCRKNQLTNYTPEDIDIPRSAKMIEKKILQPNDLKILFTVDTTLIYGKPIREPFINAFRLQVLLCLRPGEVAGLKKTDRVGNSLHLQRSINVMGETTNGKNENAVRTLALSKLASQIWDNQLEYTDSEFLFPGYTSKIYYHHLQKYCVSNNIMPISPYELRHTSFSVLQTLPEALVKTMGGHSKNMDTFGTYGHEVDGDKELTAQLIQDRFENLLGSSKEIG